MNFTNFQFPNLEFWHRPWWVKIDTHTPACTYFFGPFKSRQEAKRLQGGYIEDLVQEGAQEITVKIEQTRPKQLTIDDMRR